MEDPYRKWRFDYTAYARRFSTEHPVLSQVLIQVYFWIIANLFLATVVHLAERTFRATYSLPIHNYYLPTATLSVFVGVFYGVLLGLTNLFFEKKTFRNKPLGRIIFFKTIVSVVVLYIFFFLIKNFVFKQIIVPYFFHDNSPLQDSSWKYIFYLLVVFYSVMTILVNFIVQVNKKYGPGVLVPLLLGKYRTPREEERIFMFMDLTSSTTIAEKLGHIRYSLFIRDSFIDINHVLRRFNAEIYQYVGDEVVVTWLMDEGLKKHNCVDFFFACQREFIKRRKHYEKHFGFVPEFKAGLHLGKVTAVEIGEIKRDIAYHGDTLNTASRIQGLCKGYSKTLLASDDFILLSKAAERYHIENLGSVLLKGKSKSTDIYCIGDVK